MVSMLFVRENDGKTADKFQGETLYTSTTQIIIFQYSILGDHFWELIHRDVYMCNFKGKLNVKNILIKKIAER